MFPEQGRKCVCDVFDKAIQDFAPIVGRERKHAPLKKKILNSSVGGVNDNHTSSAVLTSAVSSPPHPVPEAHCDLHSNFDASTEPFSSRPSDR